MKKGKRIIALGMALAMTFGCVQTVFAAAITDEQKQRYEDGIIEFDEIGTYVANYNMTVKKNNRTLDQYGDATVAGADEYREAAEDLESSYSQLSDRVDALDKDDPTYGMQLAALTSNMAVLRATARSLEKQADSMENGSSIDKKMLEIQLKMAEATIVNTVQGLYPTYHQIEEGIEQLESSLHILQQNHQKIARSKEVGLVTEVDVAALELQMKTLENSLKSLENQKENLLQSIGLLIGKNSGDKIILGSVPAPDYEYADSISVMNDLQRAINNNYGLMYARREVGSINSSVDKKLKLEEIEREEQTVASNLNQQYNTILLSQQALAQEKAILEQEQKLLDQAQRRYDLGMITKLDFEQQQLSYDTQASAVRTEETNLFWAIESYKWIVKGL